MRIQIADDDGSVLYVPALNAHLERDLRALFPDFPRHRVLKNRRTRHALSLIESAILELRQESRFSSVSGG